MLRRITSLLAVTVHCLPLNSTPIATPPVRVAIQSIQGYGKYEAFARAAAHKLEQVINSPAFADSVKHSSYSILYRQRLNPTQIYARIRTAHELLGPGGQDGVVDLRLRTLNPEKDGQDWLNACEINSKSGTIGMDGSNSDGVIATCPQWLAKYATENDTAALAAHFMHEYAHIIGFKHARWVAASGGSVPYRVQNIIYYLAKHKK